MGWEPSLLVLNLLRITLTEAMLKYAQVKHR
jgi:hypothetical protein